MLRDLKRYLAYFERVRERTLQVVDRIPLAHFEWAPRAGDHATGDIVRHLTAAEQMDVGASLGDGWHYPGHASKDWGTDLAGARANLVRVHGELVARLRAAGDAVPAKRSSDPISLATRFLRGAS